MDKVRDREARRLKRENHKLRCVLRDVDNAHINRQIELPMRLRAKIVNLIGVFGK